MTPLGNRTPASASRLAADRPRQNARRSFSLVELVAVLVVCAVLAALAGLSVRSHIDRVRLSLAVEQLQRADQRMRRWARKSDGPLFMQIHTDPPQLLAAGRRPRALAGGVRIATLMTPGRRAQAGSLQIRYSRTGQSGDWAVQLAGPSGGRRWVVVLGTSGQQLVKTKEAQARALLGRP